MNDQELAGLLDAAPNAPDPAFRFEVFKRVAERTRRRIATARAARRIPAALAATCCATALETLRDWGCGWRGSRSNQLPSEGVHVVETILPRNHR